MTDRPPRRGLDRAQRLTMVLARDGARCIWCGREFTGLVEATTDHLVPRLKGGPSWIENEVAACRRCNSRRGHQAPTGWVEECERRGWSPNREALSAVLASLAAVIVARGGQRKALRYLESQRRHWERR